MRLVGSDLPSKSNLIPSIQCAWGRGGGPPAPSSVRGTHYPPQTPIPQHQDRMNPSLPCSETVRNRSQSAGHRMKVVALQCSCAPVGSVQSNWHHQRQILHWSPDASGRRRCNWSVSTTTSPPSSPLLGTNGPGTGSPSSPLPLQPALLWNLRLFSMKSLWLHQPFENLKAIVGFQRTVGVA